MVFDAIVKHAEPFALDTGTHPLSVSVRAQVILGFITLGLGKGGLGIVTFLFAMAWLDKDTYLIPAVVCSVFTLMVMAVGYIATLGRVEAVFDINSQTVTLKKRAPFYRWAETMPLSDYRGIETHTDETGVSTLTLVHGNAQYNIPLCRKRLDGPKEQAMNYGRALGVAVFNPVELKLGASSS